MERTGVAGVALGIGMQKTFQFMPGKPKLSGCEKKSALGFCTGRLASFGAMAKTAIDSGCNKHVEEYREW